MTAAIEAPPEVYFLGELAARMELYAVYATTQYERESFKCRAARYRELQFAALGVTENKVH
jgi:hypothetical protein